MDSRRGDARRWTSGTRRPGRSPPRTRRTTAIECKGPAGTGRTSRFRLSNLNCTVLEGSFLMSMVASDDNVTQKDFPCYENLREITGSVLIFHVA